MTQSTFSINTPVVLIIFKRPDTTERVFEAIRQARPTKLFVIADGPRADRPGEAEKCAAARAVIDRVDWDCEVIKNYSEINLGCGKRVASGLNWFFENEPEGIILEDDCLPDSTFFPYAEEMLIRYRDDKRIMSISGNQFYGDEYKIPHSYSFSRYSHMWGWASWRRAWQYYDRDMTQWPMLRNTNWLMIVGDKNIFFKHYWTQQFDKTFIGEIDTWDYQWFFSCWSHSGLTIVPSLNLVRNIGHGEDATHTIYIDNWLSNLPLQSLIFPLSHPPSVIRDHIVDKITDENRFKIGWKMTLKSELLKIKIIRDIWKLKNRLSI